MELRRMMTRFLLFHQAQDTTRQVISRVERERTTMERRIALAAVLCAIGLHADVGAAEKVGVYLTAGTDQGHRVVDGFVDPSPSIINAGIQDSVMDIARVFNGDFGWGVMKLVTKREKAKIFMQVVGREEVNGNYVVHARATFKDHTFDLTGTSVHQWKQSADQIARQLADWIKVNRDTF
jgi:hypothetical protein